MNHLVTHKEYYPKVTSRGDLIEYDLQKAEERFEKTWANLHVVAIVGIIALTVISISNDNRVIELSKQNANKEVGKPYYNFNAFTGKR